LIEDEFEFKGPDWGKFKKPAFLLAGVVTSVLGWLAISVVLRDPPDPVFGAGVEDEVAFPLETEEQVAAARETWQRFVEAASIEDRAMFVRDPGRVLPLMRDYYVKRGHPLPTMSNISGGRSVTIGHRVMVFFEVESFSGPVYPVAVGWEEGGFAVDWESLEAYGTMDWSEFIERRPTTEHLLRVYLSELPERWQPMGLGAERRAFQMGHRDDGRAPVVVQAAGELAIRLEEFVRGKRVPLTAEVKWIEANGCFEICRLVSEGWSQ